MTLVISFLKQPMVHFIVVGAVLFTVYGFINEDDASGDGQRIVVDEPTLLRFLQYRSRAFDSEMAAQRLSTMTRAERERLLDRLVREEALFREAQRLGLHTDDYVIKQRLVQKVEYLVRGFGWAKKSLDQEAVSAYYADNRSRYEEPASATFSHVFVRGVDATARQRIEALAGQLNSGAVPFSRAMGYGDRFAYHANYVERSRDMIASHFGDEFGDALFTLSPDQTRWQGPIVSKHGYHLLMIVKRDPGSVPSLESIYERVAEDALRAAIDEQTEQAVRNIIEDYTVEVDGLPWASSSAQDHNGVRA